MSDYNWYPRTKSLEAAFWEHQRYVRRYAMLGVKHDKDGVDLMLTAGFGAQFKILSVIGMQNK